ncbi:acetate--CoA ligase family protein [Acinetobacter qingfengensis]|uniref:Acyl-CoA synthetase n=1 Tax=Acinetobacter qingfengensis TaxID=1262585 RepID=A0A1E7RC95_9GAMM|nr:acetate--CoA ligase family protein [Acinetobacter qingfengensis]KAA8735062.1 acetate--CoA ligase family protein [Acinetobacter qingfengensis]OEY97020.1 acyl-CoA synthetase [Acinetobacter qingfengensis]
MTHSVLNALLNPDSVALIGASDHPARIGGRPLRYLMTSGYQGEIFPVNPNREHVQGVRAYPDLASLPKAADVALLAVPASATVQAVRDCAEKGIQTAIVFSAGFAEAGDEGKIMQQQMLDAAKETKLRLLGPNCLGVFNAYKKFYGTFSTVLDGHFIEPGAVSIVSQSGAYGSHIAHLCRKRGLGVGYWVTTGNECDIDMAEALGWVVEQPEVKVVLAYAEGIRHRDRFIAALEKAQQNGVSIIFMKVGRSAVGAQAASSHTAALAGSDTVFDAVLRQYGVYRAKTTAEQIDIAYAVTRAGQVTGNRLGIFTLSGGFGIQMADDAEAAGLDVAPMPEAAQDELRQLLPYASPVNPVDATAQAVTDLPMMTAFIRAMIEKGQYHFFAGILGSGPSSPTFADALCQALDEATENATSCIKCLTMSAPVDIIRNYEDKGFLVYEDGAALIHALGAIVQLKQWQEAAKDQLKASSGSTIAIPQRMMNEHEAKHILGQAGVPFPAEEFVDVMQDPAQAANRIGYPQVMKIASADLPHKTEVGGVKLHLNSAEEVRQAKQDMLDRVRQLAPDAHIDGVILSPMISGGIETIVGVFNDDTFGPVVMFGLGGVFVEVLKDITFRIAPFNHQEAYRMIMEIKGSAMLEGVRGELPADIDALANMLADLSQFAASNAHQFESIDLNPVIVRPKGKGVVALDALIIPKK